MPAVRPMPRWVWYAAAGGALAALLLLGWALARPGARDPWPECAPVRAWLDENLDDPSGWEVVRWEGRADDPERDRVVVELRYRARNRAGAWQVNHCVVALRDGRVVEVRPDD